MTENRLIGTVHVLDDDESIRTSLKRLLSALGYTVRTHATAASYLIEPPAAGPSCLILDVRMPGVSGLEIQEALARLGLKVPIIFLTAHGDIPMSVRAMRAGAADFLTKPVNRDQLVASVQAALAGQAASTGDAPGLADLKARYDALTARERDVFEGVVGGKLNKHIAAQLEISERTVKALRAQMLGKMQAGCVAELVRQAERLRN